MSKPMFVWGTSSFVITWSNVIILIPFFIILIDSHFYYTADTFIIEIKQKNGKV